MPLLAVLTPEAQTWPLGSSQKQSEAESLNPEARKPELKTPKALIPKPKDPEPKHPHQNLESLRRAAGGLF